MQIGNNASPNIKRHKTNRKKKSKKKVVEEKKEDNEIKFDFEQQKRKYVDATNWKSAMRPI